MKKVALITGASGGIGSAVAKKLASEGYFLYLHFHQNEKNIDQLINQLSEKTDCMKVNADLSVRDGVRKLISQLNHKVDLLILNSGKSYFGLMTDMSEEEVQQMVQLQITSPYMLAKEMIPSMVNKKAGNIIVISSIWGMVKGGQNSFVKALAKELAPSRIRVNAIAPGAVETDMLQSFTNEDLINLAEEIPLGRIGQPDEVADAAVFLASDKASYITGQVLSVNGGWQT